MKTQTTITMIIAVAATNLAMGCATAPLRTEGSTSGIRAAEEVGAKHVPEASLHLQLAKEELQKAEELEEQGEHERASSMLTRAEADAELAVLLSRESAEKSEAQSAATRVKELRHDYDQPAQ